MIVFSCDDGDMWIGFIEILGVSGWPMLLTYYGGGKLLFVVGRWYFSYDYGCMWIDCVEHLLTCEGRLFYFEGNVWVDCDQVGQV